LIKWYNRVVGHEPLIVGGWAAWAYHKGLGSKDIDLVFPGEATMQQTLFDYFKSHGYQERKVDFFDYEFYKHRKTKNGEIDILVDGVSLNRSAQVTGTKITIPWKLAEKHKQKYSFGKDADAYIVTPEMLLVYKVGALVGRDSKLAVATGHVQSHYQAKLWKDVQDILGLFSSTQIDKSTLLEIIGECGLDDEFLKRALLISERYLENKEEKHAFQEKWKEKLEPASLKDGLPKHLKKSTRTGL